MIMMRVSGRILDVFGFEYTVHILSYDAHNINIQQILVIQQTEELMLVFIVYSLDTKHFTIRARPGIR